MDAEADWNDQRHRATCKRFAPGAKLPQPLSVGDHRQSADGPRAEVALALHIIIGLLLAIALFYFWLIGHWFARVPVFLMLAVVGFIAGANIPPHNPTGSIICGIIGAAFAWPLASIPIYYRRRQITLGAHTVASRKHWG